MYAKKNRNPLHRKPEEICNCYKSNLKLVIIKIILKTINLNPFEWTFQLPRQLTFQASGSIIYFRNNHFSSFPLPKTPSPHPKKTLPIISVGSFVTHKVTFVISKVSFVISKVSFVISKVSFVISKVSFVISKVSFVISKVSFVISKVSFVIFGETFVTLEETFVTLEEWSRLTFC